MATSYKNLTIRTSLTLVMCAFVAVLAIVSALGIMSLKSSNDSLQTIYTVDTPALAELEGSSEELLRLRQSLATYSSYLNLGDIQEANTVLKRYDGYIKKSDALWAAYMQRPKLDESERMQSKKANEIRQRFFKEIIEPTTAALKGGDISGFNRLQATKAPPAYAEYTRAVKALEDIQLGRQKARYEAAQQTFHTMTIVLGTAMAIALVIGFLARQALIGAIVKPVDQAVDHFDRIANGDLTAPVEASGKNEMSRLFAALKRMQEALVKTVRDVRDSSEAINNGAGEIARGNIDLSSRTEEQASSLEETAASMEELTTAVKQNADNARQASQLAVNASETAARGGEVVGQVVDTMQGIAESSRQVSEILSVIDGIAFQTNILALNAAVEAARAGEQGRGFAVVAGEVRTLAQRSAAAAKEIKALIDDSAQRVHDGSAQVIRAGQTMDEIVQAVKRVTDIMGEISAASIEQSSGIEQVNRAVTQMDEMTQQNAALVEQAAAAASSLEEQAQRLREAVAVFRLDGAEDTSPGKHRQSAGFAPPRLARAA